MSLIRISKHPTGRQLLVFGIAWALCFGGLGLSAWRHGRGGLGAAVGILAAAVPLAGLVSRPFLRLAYVGLSYATYPIGVAVSYIVLAFTYFVALTPIGLIMRVFGHDPLARKFDPQAATYWVTRPKAKAPETYFKQN
jgi:hypothetical protein